VLFGYLLFEFRDLVPLLSELTFFILNLSGKILDFLFNLDQLVFCDLFLSFCFKPHILNLCQIACVFFLDLVVLRLCVLCYLIHHLFVVSLQLADVLFELVYHGPLFLDCLAMLFLGLHDCLLVVSFKLKPDSVVLVLLDLQLCGQLLLPGSVFKHLLRILIASCFQRLVLSFLQLLNLLLVVLLYVLLAGEQLLVFVLRLNFIRVELIFQLLNLVFLLIVPHFAIDRVISRSLVFVFKSFLYFIEFLHI
jgi:hypothetical protein